MSTTPFFPAFRSRLGPMFGPAARVLSQATLSQLQERLGQLLPPSLLSSEDDGLNSRERAFPLRLTFECFLWQMLNPAMACREVVRHVQALRRLKGLSPISQGDSAYVQARLRLPRNGWKKPWVQPPKRPMTGLAPGHCSKAVASLLPKAPQLRWPTPLKIRRSSRSLDRKNPEADSRW